MESRERCLNARRQAQAQAADAALKVEAVDEGGLPKPFLELPRGLLKATLAERCLLEQLTLCQWEAEPRGRFGTPDALRELAALP